MNRIVDYAHSQIQATVRLMMISKARARFDRFTVNANIDEKNAAGSKIDVQIEAASVNTHDEKRDARLRSPDFLDAVKYPYLTFKSRRGEMVDATHKRLIGDLTIRDVTREVVLDVEHLGRAKSPRGGTSAGLRARAAVSWKDWGLDWNTALETSGWLVSDAVNIDIEIKFKEVPELVEQAKPGESTQVTA